ncbi:PEPxxWA-CTERM sorting domain-containing protein [Sphingomonas quercus]|uniref:PEPxxWA-CTERM sorting domain-containing protein n=1 Tax=Sphingomonas quercus TaxID=2842451 RepID=UPI00209B9A65|nr:PEPxxWA-CTERM sorting domain-containing protein [Sphingomonas quercus]
MRRILFAASIAIVAGAMGAGAASAQITRVSSGNFNASAGVITFSEYAGGTENPSYAPAQYGGDPVSAPNVTFGGWFVGQSLSANPGVDCPGAAASACLSGNPSAGLALDGNAPATFITSDGSNPTSPVLSGSPQFDGPISVLFSVDQLAVGFDGGFFNAVGSTGIRAFDRQGNILGTVANLQEGIEFLGLATTDGLARIAGVQLTLVGSEPAGFAIDNLRFGVAGQVVIPGVPEPATWAMFIGGFGLIGAAMRRRPALAQLA